MIFYRIKCNGKTVDWERTQADAKANVKNRDQEAEGKTITGHSFEQEDVPMYSHELCAWLKANAVHRDEPAETDVGATDYRDGIDKDGMATDTGIFTLPKP